jgi:uncharacterized protein YxeA
MVMNNLNGEEVMKNKKMGIIGVIIIIILMIIGAVMIMQKPNPCMSEISENALQKNVGMKSGKDAGIKDMTYERYKSTYMRRNKNGSVYCAVPVKTNFKFDYKNAFAKAFLETMIIKKFHGIREEDDSITIYTVRSWILDEKEENPLFFEPEILTKDEADEWKFKK